MKKNKLENDNDEYPELRVHETVKYYIRKILILGTWWTKKKSRNSSISDKSHIFHTHILNGQTKILRISWIRLALLSKWLFFCFLFAVSRKLIDDLKVDIWLREYESVDRLNCSHDYRIAEMTFTYANNMNNNVEHDKCFFFLLSISYDKWINIRNEDKS